MSLDGSGNQGQCDEDLEGFVHECAFLRVNYGIAAHKTVLIYDLRLRFLIIARARRIYPDKHPVQAQKKAPQGGAFHIWSG